VKPFFAGSDYDFAAGHFNSLTFLQGNSNLGVDPNYKSPHTDQVILSLEREIVRGLGINLNYVRKWGRDYPAWQEIAGDYVQVPFTDALEDDPTATGRTFNVFQLTSDPSLRQFRISNPPGVQSDVNAFSVDLLKRMTGKWQLNASATWLRSTGRLTDSISGVTLEQRGGLQFRGFGKDPNNFVNTDGRLTGDVTWAFKVQTVYKLPLEFLISANLASHDGAHIVRRGSATSTTEIPEGTTLVLQPRGESGRLPRVTLFDVRLQKDFRLGKTPRLSVFVDAINILNSDAYEAVQSSIVTSSVFLWPLDPVDPRRFMLGAKFRF
jgi:hypothetical protein